MGNEPKLRFPEFSGVWEENYLKELVDISNEKANPKTHKTSYRCIELENLSSNDGILLGYGDSRTQESIKNKFFKGQILYGKLRPYLRKYWKAEFDGLCSSEIWVLIGKKISNNFLYYIVQGSYFNEIANISTGSKMPRADWNHMREALIKTPSEAEQAKIASFLSLFDIKIEKQAEKVAALEEYKKGLMQKIFSQEIRFKDDDGKDYPEWERAKLSDILFQHKIRNLAGDYNTKDVLSVTRDYGLINQIEYLGRSYAGVSVLNYHIAHLGDLVYTKSPLKPNPYGIIKANRYKTGIVSTLYAVYSVKGSHSHVFLDYYFSLDDHTNGYLRPLVNKGAKNDMKVNNEHVLTGHILIASIEEQTKIATFLTLFDRKIEKEKEKLDALREQKKGLLQQMFV